MTPIPVVVILSKVLSHCLYHLVFTALSVYGYLRGDQKGRETLPAQGKGAAQCFLSFLWAGMAPVKSLMRKSQSPCR